MGLDYSFPSENVLHSEMIKCFAHAGMTRLGVIDRYECGVIYRVACWFDNLGIIMREELPHWTLSHAC